MKIMFANSTKFCRRGIAAVVAAVVCTALTVASAVPAWAAGPPTADTAEAPAAPGASATLGQSMASRKPGSTVGIRGHGFVQDADGTRTTIDVPGATVFTIATSTNESGQTIGAYVDAK
jgi:hypothetical protein